MIYLVWLVMFRAIILYFLIHNLCGIYMNASTGSPLDSRDVKNAAMTAGWAALFAAAMGWLGNPFL